MSPPLDDQLVIKAAGVRLGAEQCGVIAETFGEHPERTARRMAACWNLCLGVDTEMLEELGVGALDCLRGNVK